MAEGVTRATWRRLLDPASPVFGRVAEGKDGVLLGLCHCVLHEGTWTTAPACYLEDLFVRPQSRGSGAGRALIEDVLALARAKGWSRLYWHTRSSNGTARRLYDRFAPADGFVRYRLFIDGYSEELPQPGDVPPALDGTLPPQSSTANHQK